LIVDITTLYFKKLCVKKKQILTKKKHNKIVLAKKNRLLKKRIFLIMVCIALYCMESICLRLDSALAKQIEKDMKDFRYSTKTEFIREAIRDKLKAHEKENAWKALLDARGALKGKGSSRTYEEWDNWRHNEGSREFREYLEKKFANPKGPLLEL
jgi:Arc/MetJ-type ribon-helix-helix transcriptional regulator